MAKNSNITYHWTCIFGSPEKIKEVHFIDDHGMWDSNFYRADGSFIGFKPSPLELCISKKSLEKQASYLSRVRKAMSKVKY